MTFEEERFKEFSRTQGRLRLEAEGKVDEKNYASTNSMNSAGTIGFSVVEVDGIVDHIFLSRTGTGIVLTMPGEQAGPAPFPIEGYKAISTVAAGSPVGAFYAAHVQALAKEAPLADVAWLEKEVPLLPQRALDVTMKIFQIVCDSMDKMMEGMGQAMGELVEGMGKAMGGMMESAGQAMGGMPEGADAVRVENDPGARADGAPPEKAKAKAAPKTTPKSAPRTVPKAVPRRKAGPTRRANAPRAKRKGPARGKKHK